MFNCSAVLLPLWFARWCLLTKNSRFRVARHLRYIGPGTLGRLVAYLQDREAVLLMHDLLSHNRLHALLPAAPHVSRVLLSSCGAGRALAALSDILPSVALVDKLYGADPSSNALHLASNKVKSRSDNVVLIEATPTHFPLPNRCLDLVLQLHGFQHWAEPDAVSAELRRVLRPGGRLLCTFDLTNARALRRYAIPLGNRSLDPLLYLCALEDAGFVDVTFEYHEPDERSIRPTCYEIISARAPPQLEDTAG